MGLLHLVEQHHAVGMGAHGLGQLTALLVAHVSGRRSDQTGHAVLLHVLGHVDAHDVLLVVKQRLRQRLGKLRLAHARGAEEQERADGPVRVLNARARAQDGLGDLGDGLVLADHALVQDALQAQQLLALALHQLGDRNARPAGHDPGDFLLGHAVAQQAVLPAALLRQLFLLRQLLLQLRQPAVLQLGGLVQVVLALGALDVGVHLLDLLAQLLHLADGALLLLPLGLHAAELVAQFLQLTLHVLQLALGELVVLLGQRRLLDLLLHDFPGNLVHLLGHGVDLGADHGAGLVDQVDGLVRQEAVGDVAVGQLRGADDRLVRDLHAVEHLVALLQAPQDGDGVLHAGFIHQHGLEAALQRGVLLDVLAVLVDRGRANAVQLTPGQHRLEQVARVHAALGLARAHNGVQLVDEQDDPAVALLDLLENRLQPFLELAAVLCACDQRAHVQRDQLAILQRGGHVAAHDALGQALCDGGLAHARFTDQAGVVL